MSGIADDEIPRLLRGVRTKYDTVRKTWVLLAPERVLKLDGTGAAILAEMDGERSFRQIVEALAATYAAPPDRIAGDVRKFLDSLIKRRMAEAS